MVGGDEAMEHSRENSGVLDSAVRSPLWFTASLKLNESKITILTYASMWEMRPFTRFMRFPRSSGYKNHSIKGAVCTFTTSRPNFANGPPQICAQAEDRSQWNPIFFYKSWVPAIPMTAN